MKGEEILKELNIHEGFVKYNKMSKNIAYVGKFEIIKDRKGVCMQTRYYVRDKFSVPQVRYYLEDYDDDKLVKELKEKFKPTKDFAEELRVIFHEYNKD